MEALVFSGVTKSFGKKRIMDNLTFHVNQGEKAGLVGANGAGKSTLLKMVTGDVEADSGYITLADGMAIGYLPQVLDAGQEQTIEQFIFAAQRELLAIESRLRELEAIMQDSAEAELEAVLHEYGRLMTRFEQRGGYEFDYRCQYVLTGLGLADLPRERSFATLSGGQKTRLGLAALLIRSPDLLLLDEPTNHLDFAALAWLEEYLQTYRGTLLISSHDRQFLNKTVSRILELDEHSHQIKEYTGNYDAYLEQKRRERQKWEEDYEREQAEIKQLRQRAKEKAHRVAHNRGPTDNDKFVPHYRGERVQSTISKNIRAAEKALERILNDPTPAPPQPLRFQPDFHPERIAGNTAMTVSQLRKSLADGTVLFEGISFTLETDDLLLIIGQNGAGKSTLLDILAGKITPDGGTVTIAPQVSIGYLRQEMTCANPHETVLDAFRQGLVGYREDHIAQLLSYQLFRYEEFHRKLGSLSPGQYRKLQLAKLIASRANMLIIDEPTNHLSFDVMEELEQALALFPGPVVTVSHDRWFISRFKGDVWLLENGRLQKQEKLD